MLKRICLAILLIALLLSLASCAPKKTNSELFFEEENEFFSSSYYEYDVKCHDDISVYGKIDTESKNMTINITQNDLSPISVLLNGNEIYVSLQSILDFVNNAYPEDEEMLIVSDTLNTRYSDYKYLKLKISESDIWNNILNINEAIPEGDMSWVYELVKFTIDDIHQNINDESIEVDKDNETYKTTINKEVIRNIMNSVSENQNIKDLIQTLSKEGINLQEFNLDIQPVDLVITISDEKYEINTESIAISITHGEKIDAPKDLENSYDIDLSATESMTTNVDMEINDGNAIDSEIEIPAESPFLENAEDDSVYGLISHSPEDFKDIITKTLNPIGFEEMSSTSDSIEMTYESETDYKYLVSFKNNTVTIKMETNTNDINSFSDEFADCAIPILGLKFDKYTMYSNLQETYSEATNIFNNTEQKIYTKTGTINETKIQYDIRNIDNVITISIETSRKLPET